MIALVPVRGGSLPLGAAEAVAEAGGAGVLAGDGTGEAARTLSDEAPGVVMRLVPVELGRFAPARWASQLAPLLRDEDAVILPASPDGRDLAPRIAAALGRPLLAGATRITASGATVLRWGGSQLVELDAGGPFVATLTPGVRSTEARPERAVIPGADGSGAATIGADVPADRPPGGDGDGIGAGASAASASSGETADAESLATLAPEPASMDLSEADRIMAGGAGLGGVDEFALLWKVADAMGASVGATRVVTDAGILPHDRQIGTTGVSVRPRTYVALGISGAAQHVCGLGEPEHVISVNLDRSCPMMAMADLAVVSDAAATLAALAERLGIHA